MGKIFSLLSPDEMFAQTHIKPVILNDLSSETLKDREAINSLLITNFSNDTDSLDSIPTCLCGELQGSTEKGKICPSCNSRVSSHFDRPIDVNCWIRCPVELNGIMSPIVWDILSKALTSKNWNGLEYLMRPRTKPPEPANAGGQATLREFERFGIRRGWNNVITDLQKVIQVACKRSNNAALPEFFERHKDQLICHYIPMPSKVAFVLEKSALGEYADKSLKPAKEAMVLITSMPEGGPTDDIGSRMAAVMTNLQEYYRDIFSEIGRKPNWLRKAVFCTRVHFAWRSVITSRADTHDYEEIQIPYTQACTMFEPHLFNRLTKRYGMGDKEAQLYILAHSAKPDPFLWSELEGIIRDSEKGEGIWATFARYPLLNRGSTQLLRITGIKEGSTSISILILRAPNAD